MLRGSAGSSISKVVCGSTTDDSSYMRLSGEGVLAEIEEEGENVKTVLVSNRREDVVVDCVDIVVVYL